MTSRRWNKPSQHSSRGRLTRQTVRKWGGVRRRGIETDILPYCQAHKFGVVVYSPMAAGLLTGAMTRARAADLPDNDWRSKNPELREPRLSRNLALVDTLTAAGARHGGATAGAVAVAWTLRHPAVTAATSASARQPR